MTERRGGREERREGRPLRYHLKVMGIGEGEDQVKKPSKTIQ
jgi:hypothetical protein